jgi:energy-coupling factor transport system substrate-specific component
VSATHQPPATATTGGRLTVKDLITVGVFSAFYIVAFYVAGMLGIIPIFMVLLALMCPIVGGIPFMLYLTRVKKFGMVTITGLLVGLVMTGRRPWAGRSLFIATARQPSSPT